MKTKLLLAAVAVGLLSLGWWIPRQRAIPSARALPAPTPEAAHRRSASAPELDALRAEMRLLEARIEGLQGEDGASAEASSVAPAAQQDRAAAEVADAAAAIEARLGVETADPTWSEETERQIASIFEHGEIAGTDLVDAECRASLCRVRVRHRSAAAERDLASAIWKQAPFNGPVLYDYADDGSFETTLYVARAGHSLQSK